MADVAAYNFVEQCKHSAVKQSRQTAQTERHYYSKYQKALLLVPICETNCDAVGVTTALKRYIKYAKKRSESNFQTVFLF